MCELPFPWCVYKEIQSKASCCDRITSWSWGIENGLNNFLALFNPAVSRIHGSARKA